MGQVRHGSATTTHAVRAAIQRSQTSLAQISRELGVNPKTVAKWRKRAFTHFGGNLFIVLLMMLHPTQELEPPQNPGRVKWNGVSMSWRAGQPG